MNTQLSKITDHYDRVPRKAHFHVAPRYSGGSPALVGDYIALKVAEDELGFYQISLTGTFGDEKKKLAETEGLSNIVYARWEKGRKVFRLDLLTGEEFEEPKCLEYGEIERLEILRNQRRYVGLNSATEIELKKLEWRAKLHRQKI